MSRPARPIAERFAKKVNPTPTERGCLLWTGFVDPAGRGRINSGGARGKPLVASRVAWALVHGEIAEGMCVCHHCDNPLCVNVEHLFLGSQRENIDDMLAKRRSTAGRHIPSRAHENHGCAKVTWEIVDAMRAAHASGDANMAELGRRFGIGRHQAQNIIKLRHWVRRQA